MAITLGIDLGTSGVKAMLLDTENDVAGVASKGYSVSIPDIGFAEQSPGLWWQSTASVLNELKERYPLAYGRIEAVGLSGQMHGLVAVGKDGKPLRPAIIALDQRSGKQAAEVSRVFSQETIAALLHNRVAPGFAFSSLLWVKENEPEVYEKTACIMLPKDYIRFMLTGRLGSDYSDASASGCFNTSKRQWCYELIDHFNITRNIFPECGSAVDAAGFVTDEAAVQTGIRSGTPVVYGGGDQPVQSIGNALVQEGDMISNIGTSGQIACFSQRDLYDEQLRTHTFCHALPNSFTVFGAMLNAGLSINWLTKKVLHQSNYKALDEGAAKITPGSDGLIFLPYLTGERTPHMDINAKGMFFGLTLGMDDRHFARAVMEGVVFSLRDSLVILQQMGMKSRRIIASGGGAKSPLWLQMQADILGSDIIVSKVEEQACLGACLLAAIGINVYSSAAQACAKHVSFHDTVYRPDLKNHAVYLNRYGIYRELYQRNRELMP